MKCAKCGEPMLGRKDPLVAGMRRVQARGMCSYCYQRGLETGELTPRPRAMFNGKEIQCQKCKRMLCVSKFKKHPQTTSGYNHTCRFCSKLFERYGITEQTYREMFERQFGICAICPEQLKLYGTKTHIDHDHSCCSTGKGCGKCVRGLLCPACNTGLGGFKDSTESLRRAIEYLEGLL